MCLRSRPTLRLLRPTLHRMERRVNGLLCLWTIVLLGCGGEPTSPETRIRALIDEAEVAIEARDVKPVKQMISESYADRRGRDKQALKGVLAGHLLGHRVVYLLTQVKEICIEAPDRARAVVVVAMSGVPVESPEALVRVTGQIYRIELMFLLEAGVWRVLSIDERRAGIDAFS